MDYSITESSHAHFFLIAVSRLHSSEITQDKTTLIKEIEAKNCKENTEYWKSQDKYVLFFAYGKQISYYKEKVGSTIEHRWGYLYHPKRRALRLEEEYIKVNGMSHDYNSVYIKNAENKIWTKSNNKKLRVHKSMPPYALYHIRLFKTILSILTLNQFNETQIEYAGKESIKRQGKEINVYALSVPSEDATIYIDMKEYKIISLKKVMLKNPDEAIFVDFSDFQWKSGLRFPDKWSIFDDKNRDCGYMLVKEVRQPENINKDWFSEKSIKKTLFTLCSASWKDDKGLSSARRIGLQEEKMLRAAVDLLKKVYVVDNRTEKEIDSLFSEYQNKLSEINSAEHYKTPEKKEKKGQLFNKALDELKSITKNLKRKAKMPKDIVKLKKRLEEANNNWKNSEWQQRHYTMMFKEEIKKIENKYELTEKARQELRILEKEMTEKLKQALKNWPKNFKKSRPEIIEAFFALDRELKKIQKNLEKKEKTNEENNNE